MKAIEPHPQMYCPICGHTVVWVINGWWCENCDWDDLDD